MTDYTKNNDYSDKDALAEGDPEKIILGADIDSELDEIQTAIATKYDSSDIATQPQAEAGVSNSVLMTPLRTKQMLSGSFGGSGAGMLGDILALADPNADRILFWDDSADAVALLTPSTGVQIIGTNLSTKDSEIVHNSLSGYDANRHIDHTAVSITTAANSGLAGGGTIAATRDLVVDINSLTSATVDSAADYMIFYDATDGLNKKSLVSSVAGVALGDGAWYLGGAQSLTAATEATIVYNTASYNSLQRGTFSLATGIYTAGSDGARVEVSVIANITSLVSNGTFTLDVYHNSTAKAEGYKQHPNNLTSREMIGLTMTVTLAAGDTLTIKATTNVATSLTAGEKYNRLAIVELA